MMEFISNADLKVDDIPNISSDFTQEERLKSFAFAMTFDGYGYTGGVKESAELYDLDEAQTLSDLRAKLHFLHRGWRHSGYIPNEEDIKGLLQILDRIREKIKKNERE